MPDRSFQVCGFIGIAFVGFKQAYYVGGQAPALVSALFLCRVFLFGSRTDTGAASVFFFHACCHAYGFLTVGYLFKIEILKAFSLALQSATISILL